MLKLLYIKASPRGAASRSAVIADAYLDELLRYAPEIEIDRIDLATEPLPDFDGDKAAAKMALIEGRGQTAHEQTLWDQVTAMASRFAAADRYLIAAPMWNGGVPYRLKQYIDIIHQPGLLWSLDPSTGYHGLLRGKKAVLALTSGAFSQSAPSPAFGVDHHSTYLKAWLNQAGVEDITELRFQPTLLTADPMAAQDAALNDARHQARLSQARAA